MQKNMQNMQKKYVQYANEMCNKYANEICNKYSQFWSPVTAVGAPVDTQVG